jgi:peptide/nickel transport system substrate-binding protein
LLGAYPKPTTARSDDLILEFPTADADGIARALASPLTAILPRSFSPRAPDGTGAFRAVPQAGGQLSLKRNAHAARGAALLDAIQLSPSAGLADALRAFESDAADVGWLGAGLHRRRKDAVRFRGPGLGWVVLRTGTHAGRWGAPGIAQQLANALTGASLEPLGLKAAGRAKRPGSRWQGASTTLSVRGDCPYLVEVANVVATGLSASAHAISVGATTATRIATQKGSGDFSLMIDVVRAVGPEARHTLLALLTADDPRLATHAPRVTTHHPSEMTRGLRLGIIGELRPFGAHAAAFRELATWDLGQVWQGREG